MFLQCGRFRLSLERPLVMGVVNVTPDSFSDGGLYADTLRAVAHARRLVEEGADILDIGGESTRPGAAPVALEEERRRVLPVLEAMVSSGVPVSVDTRKPQLMREAIGAGAAMINDVAALSGPAALDAVSRTPVAVCLMHMQGDPGTMQLSPSYQNVVVEVSEFLSGRVALAERAGIARDRIVVDPGFGFGKTVEHNLELLRSLGKFRALGGALLAGLSRKAVLGKLTGREPLGRVHASVAAALLAVQNGAHIVRVHDVAATRDALAVWLAVKDGK
jgi:dihydropteroate synthase